MFRRILLPASAAATALAFEFFNFDRPKKSPLQCSREEAANTVRRYMIRNGVPGISVGVSVNGHHVWTAGFGYADAEQLVPCTERTVMRIASISKAITAAIAARLVQSKQLNLDTPIQTYLPSFPVKRYHAVPVDITTRQLLCHTSGIRHYKEENINDFQTEKKADGNVRCIPEFLSNKEYEKIEDALEVFINDDLVSKPGEKFVYTTHGYTLLSAILEKVAGKSYPEQAKDLFKLLGMNHTQLDRKYEIIPHRSRYYYRDAKGRLQNAPDVNNSCKWAGGGILSTVDDLLVFAEVMLYSYHLSHYPHQGVQKKPLLESEVLETFWNGEVEVPSTSYRYALGWYKSDKFQTVGGVDSTCQPCAFWMHTGGAVGASSVLLIKPNTDSTEPQGICVAVMANLQNCGELTHLALEIAGHFQGHSVSSLEVKSRDRLEERWYIGK